MNNYSYKLSKNKVIIKIQTRVCETAEELLSSELFFEIVKRCVKNLSRKDSILLKIFAKKKVKDDDIRLLIKALIFLSKMPINFMSNVVKGSKIFLKNTSLLNDFVEYLYNWWRSFERFIVCESEVAALDKRPYRTFNETVERLTHLIRGVYRDIGENITGSHPRVYRQVRAGSEMATIAKPKKDIFNFDDIYKKLSGVSLIRQVLLHPPLVLYPPMNKRTGRFEKISKNPLEVIDNFNEHEWLCYPARIGPLLVLIYFQEKVFELGFSLSNLFELADDEDLNRKPDAVYVFGVPGGCLDNLGAFPTVFYDDIKNDMLVAAVPNRDEFGYFGYLKKMALTLHNIRIMKIGKLPFHGALVRVILRENKQATILLIGDTGAGKSETLEAFRILGEDYIGDLIIIADDMGSIDIDKNGDIIGYGTEIGAFLRLDDLQPGYAFGQVDRAIIMNPHLLNARIILPVTTFENVIKGSKIDFILYANNYEEIDDDHPIIEELTEPGGALRVFREGTVMSKGTTTSTGLVRSYFANIFGPPQYRELHDRLAEKYFKAFFEKGIFVGQIRTRLGISGYELKGPEEAAKELIDIIKRKY